MSVAFVPGVGLVVARYGGSLHALTCLLMQAAGVPSVLCPLCALALKDRKAEVPK